MGKEEIVKLREMLAAHGSVVRCQVTLQRMKVANDEARSKGEDDPYESRAFHELEHEIQEYVAKLEG